MKTKIRNLVLGLALIGGMTGSGMFESQAGTCLICNGMPAPSYCTNILGAYFCLPSGNAQLRCNAVCSSSGCDRCTD